MFESVVVMREGSPFVLDGDTPYDVIEEMSTIANCGNECSVEVDGTCPHGFRSAVSDWLGL
jgi:hypothetical protein